MAAELLRHQSLVREYEVGSRGMVVLFPEPANPKAEVIMRSQQMTLEAHEATQLTEADLDEETLEFTYNPDCTYYVGIFGGDILENIHLEFSFAYNTSIMENNYESFGNKNNGNRPTASAALCAGGRACHVPELGF